MRLKHLLSVFLTLLTLSVGQMWGANKTYKLTAVSSVSAGNKYVFVQDGYAMNNTVSSNALQCTNSYNTTGLAGTETYIWTLETATGGFKMKNVYSTSNQYLKTSSTSCSFVSSSNTPGVFSFTFTNGICLIEDQNNKSSNKPRFLGYTNSTDHVYKAYANSNIDSYSHAITVYRLDEEVSCTSSITITKGSNPANGTFTLTTSGSVCIDNGNASTTVNATPSTNYHLASVTSTGGGTIGEISNNSCTVTNIGANTTINVTFEADPQYTVTWVAASNSSFNTQTNYAGTDLTSPGTPDASTYCPGGKVFMGWTATPIEGESANAPSDLFTSVTGKSIPVGGITYYAVFATGTGSGSDKYKVTTSLSVGKTYVMGAVKAAASTTLANNTTIGAITFSSTYTSTSWGQYSEVTPNSSGEIAANSVTTAMQWTLESVTSGKYAFKKGNNYMYLKTSTGQNSCGLYTSANVYLEDATSTCKDAFLMHPQSGTGGNRAMLNVSSGGYRVYGTSTNASASMCPYVRFYEYTPGVTYSNYATSCCTPLGSINGSFF